MKLLTKVLEKQLRANAAAQKPEGGIDFKPVVKFFGGATCTWLITELDANGDTMFGLCDLGMGEPELGYVSLWELKSVRFSPFRLPVERDLWFKADKTISQYAAEAREKGRIAA